MTRRQTLLFAAAATAGLSSSAQQGRTAGPSARGTGFWYPEETEPHERTFMQWPVNPAVHDDPDFLDDLQKTIAKIANTIAEFEPVVMLAAPPGFPTMRFYQLWHERAHHASAHRWLRGVIADVGRALVPRPACAAVR